MPVYGFSPRMWRCFLTRAALQLTFSIFSTYVEVFPTKALTFPAASDFLHVCGGVSGNVITSTYATKFSPRMWRCFLVGEQSTGNYRIFSTYVEVFPFLKSENDKYDHFLHVCGGVSTTELTYIYQLSFSPRMWRCFWIPWKN